MALYDTLCFLLFGTFLSSLPMLHECEKQKVCTFQVYPTEFCPRNQTEWDKRSSDRNCNETNSYMCVPNEKFTNLLEFCYKGPRMLIVQDTCLYFSGPHNDVNVYACQNFEYGCPSYHFYSSKIYEYPSCIHVKNGCFVAEPSCKRQPPQRENQNNVKTIAITLGVSIPTCLLCILFVSFVIKRISQPRKRSDDEEQHTETASECSALIQTKQGIKLRKSDDEEQHTETTSELLPLIQTDKRDNAVLIEQGIKLRKSDDEEQHTETTSELLPLIQTDKRDNAVLIEQESPLDQAMFQHWKKDDSKFVSTRACKEVEKRIEIQNLVIVTGNSGSGKSAIIQHIALRYRDQGWTVKPVYNVKEITDTYSSGDVLQSKILFVFNDPIGNESFDEIAYNSWKEQDERLKACLTNNKMLLSSRKYILLDDRVRGMLNDKSCSIDLSDDKHKLNKEEKENIFRSYALNSGLPKDDINGILTTEEYFPLLCKLYFRVKNNQTIGPRFFKEPFNVFQEQIKNFRNDSRKECNEKYCALVLLVLCNNQLCVEDIHKDDRLREKFKLALKLCGMMANTASHIIGDALKTLEGFFVKKIEDTYHFYHDFVMEATTFVFGTDYPRETIQYADIGFLRRRVNLKSSNDNRKEEVDIFTIYLNDKYVSDLVDRLFNDVFRDRMFDVVLNPCMRNEKVAACFIQKLKDSPEKLHSLLTKKTLHEKVREQKDNQALKQQSFASKLDFLYFEDKVPILSAIIVFCHTNISKHCLETLQRSRNSLKYTPYFSAVCCNGSMDLFNVFPKEQIKWFFVKKWGEYYPIHIASLFHNYEILRELIQVKNNVNLRTEILGNTPLMLAVFNTDTSEQKNKEKRNKPIDITVELLLTHGADINLCSFLGSPLHIASSKGNDHAIKLLLGKGADVNSRDKNQETPLHKASEWGRESTVQLLLDKGADINSRDKNQETPLHKASSTGYKGTVQLLLEKGADINSCDTNKETPLHKASILRSDSTLQLLLDQGADMYLSDINNETPIHKASEWGRESTVQLLLDKGADINSCDTNKETPLHKASKWGRESTVQLLLDNGADINSCDTNKETPLHKASKWGRESTVQLLLDKGADINSCDTNKETPLYKASEC